MFRTIVLTLIGNIQAFAMPLIFAGGGSGSVGTVTSVLGYRNSLSMFLTYLYQEGFIDHKYGYGSAIAMVIFIITLVLTAFLAPYRDRPAVAPHPGSSLHQPDTGSV